MRINKGESIYGFPKSYVVIDIETTGFDPVHNKIIEIGALKVENYNVVDSFSSLVNPGILIDSFISELTGITNEQLSSAPYLNTILPLFDDFVADSIIVGHNVSFDINFIYDNYQIFLNKPFSNDYIDTLPLSRKYYKDINSHRLSVLKEYLNINIDVSHRALVDCYTANILFQKLRDKSLEKNVSEIALLDQLTFNETNPFYHKNCAIKGIPQLYSYSFINSVMEKCQANFSDIFFKDCDFIIFSNYTYKKFKSGETSQKFEKANKLVAAGSLTVLSEKEWCQMLNIPIPTISSQTVNYQKTHAKDIVTQNTFFDETHPLYGKACCFTGALESMQRKDAMQLVVDLGGTCTDSITKKTNFLILGNTDYCSNVKGNKTSKTLKAEKAKLSGQDIEIISENVFLDMINQ